MVMAGDEEVAAEEEQDEFAGDDGHQHTAGSGSLAACATDDEHVC
jgi:hypothetical protein